MTRFSRILSMSAVLTAGLLCSALALPAQGPPSNLPNKNCETPFRMVAAPDLASGQSSLVVDFLPAVPADKRFLVNYINAHAQLPTGQVMRFIVFIGGNQFHFAPTSIGSDFGTDNYILSEPVFFASQNTEQIRLNTTRFSGNVDPGFARVTLSGCLVDRD